MADTISLLDDKLREKHEEAVRKDSPFIKFSSDESSKSSDCSKKRKASVISQASSSRKKTNWGYIQKRLELQQHIKEKLLGIQEITKSSVPLHILEQEDVVKEQISEEEGESNKQSLTSFKSVSKDSENKITLHQRDFAMRKSFVDVNPETSQFLSGILQDIHVKNKKQE